MNFLADENISTLVIEWLRRDGHDVVSVREGCSGSRDTLVLRVADEARRILITEDADFGELVIRRRLRAVGVVLLELDRLSNEAEARRVASVVQGNAELLAGNLVIIEPGRTRIRPLPVSR